MSLRPSLKMSQASDLNGLEKEHAPCAERHRCYSSRRYEGVIIYTLEHGNRIYDDGSLFFDLLQISSTENGEERRTTCDFAKGAC